MMMGPQVVGVLLKKPGQQNQPQIPPLDPQETKIRGELYVEDLGEKRIVSIRMGWLWVEGTSMRLPLRALNLRQAAPSLCQPHALALGFTLSNSKDHSLATFWADTEPIYWSWVKAIAAELVRQTPFRAQRCVNFLEILTICPKGSVALTDSPTEARRRSRSELRCWSSDSPTTKSTATVLQESRRRAKSELRGWSSSNSSDEDLLGEFRSIPAIITKNQPVNRTWGCSESSEGSDDSLPWNGMSQSSIDSVDATVTLPNPETREQRIQRYKEARRRENEARSRRVLEEDAKKRRARLEENDNDILKIYGSSRLKSRTYNVNDNDDLRVRSPKKEAVSYIDTSSRVSLNESSVVNRLPPVKPTQSVVRFESNHRNENDKNNNGPRNDNTSPNSFKLEFSERRSRARERRSVREKGYALQLPRITNTTVETLQERKERLASVSSRIPVPQRVSQCCVQVPSMERAYTTSTLPKSSVSLPICDLHPCELPCEIDVARLLEKCQRVDHYVPVREKLTLFESLSRLGGRLARSTEDLGRTSSKSSPKGKQRARSLHDLNRGAKSMPVREMCRFFEKDIEQNSDAKLTGFTKARFSDPLTSTRITWKDSSSVKNSEASHVRTFSGRKHYHK